MTSAWTGKPCAECGRKKGKNQANQKYCFTCGRLKKKEQKKRAHDKHVGEKFGLLEGEYEKILEAQGGVCAICKRATGKTKALAVEHDHEAEKLYGIRESIRGLACGRDNYEVLGFLGDDPEIYMNIVEYLISPPAWKVLGIERPIPTRVGNWIYSPEGSEDNPQKDR
jgi:Recombination endonuclease VII